MPSQSRKPSPGEPSASSATISSGFLRPASLEDLEALCHFYQRSCAFLEQRTNYPLWRWGVHPNTAKLQAAIENREMFVWIIEDEIAGAVIVNHELEGMEAVSWQNSEKGFACLHLFAIDPRLQKRQAGSAFLTLLLNHLQSDSAIDSVRLNLIEGNLPARALYTRHGFKSKGKVSVHIEEEGVLPFELMERVF